MDHDTVEEVVQDAPWGRAVSAVDVAAAAADAAEPQGHVEGHDLSHQRVGVVDDVATRKFADDFPGPDESPERSRYCSPDLLPPRQDTVLPACMDAARANLRSGRLPLRIE